MQKLLSRIIPISLLIALVALLIPTAVLAAPTVTSITPNTIVNHVVNVITVAGVEFDDTAAVLLDGSALETSFLNAQTLTATSPAGVPAGSHTITVTMSSGVAGGSATLTVLAPTPIPPPTATIAPLDDTIFGRRVRACEIWTRDSRRRQLRLNSISAAR